MPAFGSGDEPPTTDREKIERLHAIAAEMMACRTEREVYQLTVAAAERVLAFDICGVDAVEDGWFVPKAVSAGMADVGYQRASVEEGGLAGEAFRTGEAVVTDDVAEAEAADPAAEEYRSILTVPVGDIGVFQAGARRPGAFDDGDRELAELLLAHTEEALRRIRFETALRERNDTIERLHGIAAELVGCEDEAAVYDRVVAAVEEVLEFRVSVVLAATDDGRALEVVAATDDPLAPDPGTRVEADHGNVTWTTYETGQSVVVGDVAAAERADPHYEAYRSAVSVPMGDVGVVQAIATEVDAFDEDDRELAELLATQAGEVVSRLRAERRRLEERDRLAALFRNVPDPAVSATLEDDRAVVTAVNPAFEEVFGYDEADVVGEAIDEFIVPAGEREAAREINQAARSGEGFHTETTRLTADGEAREFLLHVVPVDGDPGDAGAYAIYTDITDRKRRERRLGALHESARELMAADDATGVCECAVAAASDTLGLPVSSVHLLEGGRLEPVAWTDGAEGLFEGPPPTFDADDADVWGAFQAGETGVFTDVDGGRVSRSGAVESALVIPLGEWGVFLSVARSGDAFDDQAVDLAGVLAATVETALDRTARERELRERERELQRQNERLDEFAGVVSHDLRNPLGVARGNLELAARTGEAEYFERVEAAHERMESLVEDLLALARSGQVAGDPEPVALSEAARRAWATVDAPVAALEVGDDVELTADPDRLVQLLGNLFRNAVEHGSTSPRSQAREDAVEHGSTSPRSQAREDAVEHGAAAVEVEVGATDEGFYVADDGDGIPEDEREAVLEYGHSTAEDGTGLGLAIVREIAGAHGWDVAVEESEAGGARFEFETG